MSGAAPRRWIRLAVTVLGALAVAMPNSALAKQVLSKGVTPKASSGAPQFGTPVRLPTFQSCGGYEPGIAIDGFGNIFVTAHKQNHCIAAALDPSSPVGARAASWLWTSTDGVNFGDMPGLADLPVAPDQFDLGDEGDIALDDAGNVYFVDTKVADNSFSRWSVDGPGTGNMTLEDHRPVVPSLMPVDDRPWVTAHGSSTVLYAGNAGDKDSYNVGDTASGCTGPVGPPSPGDPSSVKGGRYTVFMSYDAGATFDPVGCTLPGSGWCRPAADHAADSKYLYMICTNDGGADYEVNNPGDPGFTVGTLWSFVSADDGATWTRHEIGNYNESIPGGGDGDVSWPSVKVARDGSIYALLSDPVTTTDATGSVEKIGARLELFRSTDHGQTWDSQDVTPANAGIIRYSWVDVADDGQTVGIGYETHPDVNGAWHVYAGVTPKFGSSPVYSLVDPTEVAPEGDFVFGDFFEVAFDRLGRLNVVYTRCTNLVQGEDGTDCLNSDVMFARTTS